MIRESVTLAFNPEKSDPEIKAVFQDDMARLLWLACRQNRLASQFFNSGCLKFAKVIKGYVTEGKLDAEVLYRVLSGFAKGPMDGIIGPGERDFAKELLPFILGEKTITYEIAAPAR